VLLEANIKVFEGRVQDLQNQNGFLIQDHTRISGQLDRLLMPSQEEQKKRKAMVAVLEIKTYIDDITSLWKNNTPIECITAYRLLLITQYH
jgi:hypothetical protein